MELFIGAILFFMLLAIGGVYVELSDLATHVRAANNSLSDNLTSLAGTRQPGGSATPSGFRVSLQRKSPAQRGALVTHSLLARRLVAVTAIDVDVGRAHIAAFHWAVPFIRLGRVCGICSRSNGIGRPTRPGGEGRTTGIHR